MWNQLVKTWDRLAGLVVKASTSGAEDPGFESCLRQDFSGLSHTSDLKIGTPVAVLPGAWRHRVSAGTGQRGVSILWLGEVESLISNFYLSVAAHWDTQACCWDVKQPTNQQTSYNLNRFFQKNLMFMFAVKCCFLFKSFFFFLIKI